MNDETIILATKPPPHVNHPFFDVHACPTSHAFLRLLMSEFGTSLGYGVTFSLLSVSPETIQLTGIRNAISSHVTMQAFFFRTGDYPIATVCYYSFHYR